MKIKCGFVAVIGKANAGKSSLINAIIGQKVSIVSPKPQTTRNNILGIYNSDCCQIVFVDTPGLNAAHTGLDKVMQKGIKGATGGVNAVILTVDITKGLKKEELEQINNFEKSKTPVIVVFTKIDLVEDKKVFETLDKYSYLSSHCELVPLSSLKHKNIKTVVEVVLKYLPEVEKTERYFDKDLYTDRPLKFIAAEVIREKALFFLSQEIPHGIAVLINSLIEKEKIVEIDADIVCDKNSHKIIILGKNGQMLKKIGHNARITLQKIFQKKVSLNIFIKVKPNWKNNLAFLSELGYNDYEI